MLYKKWHEEAENYVIKKTLQRFLYDGYTVMYKYNS
jgi:hypothetical protein